MPKSPLTTSLGDGVVEAKHPKVATITLSPAELPREIKAPGAGKRQRKAPKPKKKSNMVSLYKKRVRIANNETQQEPVVPKELTEQQDTEARLKKRRNSKFHPREAKDEEQEAAAESNARTQREKAFDELVKDDTEMDQAAQYEFIKRHNSHVKSKRTSSVVLEQAPPPNVPTLKPLLNNGKLGLTGDVNGLVEFATKFRLKNVRAVRRLRNFADFIPEKELKRQNYLQVLNTLSANAEGVANFPAKIYTVIKHAVAKAVFETRHARTLPNCTLTNLSHCPATTRAAEEQAIRLKRTPLVRSHVEHEQEANTMLRRHEATLRSEIVHSHDVATTAESLAAAQMTILALYRKTIDNSELDQQAKRSYHEDIQATVRLMELVMSEHKRTQESMKGSEEEDGNPQESSKELVQEQ